MPTHPCFLVAARLPGVGGGAGVVGGLGVVGGARVNKFASGSKSTETLNKTKYFRLHLTDEVRSERPMRDLRVTWD